MMREVSLETLPNVNIRDPIHDKNLPIMLNILHKRTFAFNKIDGLMV